MKKPVLSILVILFLVVIIFIVVITRIDFNHLLCTYTSKVDNLTIKATHSISIKDKYVTTLITKEVLSSNDVDTLYNYKSLLEDKYSKYQDIKYYDNKMTISNNELIITTKIDYQKIDVTKLIEIDKNNKQLFTNNKVYYKDLKKQYEQLGAICKYKK